MPQDTSPAPTQRRQPWPLGSGLRHVRLASGLVLFAYVTLHLLDHALLNGSVAAADLMLLAQKALWQGVIGSALLYGGLLIHAALGLWSLYARRYVGWRGAEMCQLLLGLIIPAMLANHVTVTRAAWVLYGLNKGYIAELAALYVAQPAWGWLQLAVLVAAWTHACLGLFFLLRLRRWWPDFQAPLLAAALLIPVLALLGYLQGGREVARDLADPNWRLAHLSISVTGTTAMKAHLTDLRNWFLASYVSAIALVLAARLVRRVADTRQRRIVIRYPGGQRARVPVGLSVLDVSRRKGIAHASVCGGRGRCSTCRVRILWSAGALPPPATHEKAVLDGIGADVAKVRLGCQLRPTVDLAVAPLIPPAIAGEFILGRAARIPGDERFLVAMFIDLRGSTSLAERRMPFDSVFLLGRFVTAATRAVITSGGRPVQFLGDGLLALFGLDCAPADACRQALDGVSEAVAEFAELAPLFGQEAGMALRYGIGVHCGRAIVGEIGFGRQIAFTALGDTINTASRLQEVARDSDVAAVVSEDVFRIAGAADPAYPSLAAKIRGRAQPITVRLITGKWETEELLS